MTDRWRIYYDDGRTFESTDGPFESAPSDGVLFIIQKIGDTINSHCGSDHYFMIDGEIISTHDIGPLLRRWGIKFGRWTSHVKFEEAGRRAAQDAKAWQLEK